MKHNYFFLLVTMLLTSAFLFSQEEWEPQKFVTGYVNTAAEYTDINYGKLKGSEPAIGLSEVALLASYKPLSNLEFKGTFVYHNNLHDVRDLLVEAYGTYTFNDVLKISAGKYLTPLSPVNQYFFAPLNTAVSLPMLVSHHFLLPQSISGLQLSGEMGGDLKYGYNLTYGSYVSVGHSGFGMLGVQGQEDVLGLPISSDPSGFARESNLGGSARVYGSYNGMINIGLNYFDGRKSYFSISHGEGTPEMAESSKYSYGVDVQLKIGSAQINGEFWKGNEETKEVKNSFGDNYSADYEGYYLEAMYTIGKITPFVRYDYVSDVQAAVILPIDNPVFGLSSEALGYLRHVSGVNEFDTQLIADVTSYTAGLSFRPIYEVLIKAEYRHIMPSNSFEMLTPGVKLDDGAVGNFMDDGAYNHYTLSVVLSF